MGYLDPNVYTRFLSPSLSNTHINTLNWKTQGWLWKIPICSVLDQPNLCVDHLSTAPTTDLQNIYFLDSICIYTSMLIYFPLMDIFEDYYKYPDKLCNKTLECTFLQVHPDPPPIHQGWPGLCCFCELSTLTSPLSPWPAGIGCLRHWAEPWLVDLGGGYRDFPGAKKI